jgi:catalase
VAVLVADGVDAASLEPALAPLRAQGTQCELLAPRDGKLSTADQGEVKSDRAIVTMSSVLYDGVLVAGGEQSVHSLLENGDAVHYVAEAYRHAKPVGAIGAGIQLLAQAPIPALEGVVTIGEGATDLSGFGSQFAEALAAHRHHGRNLAVVPA